MGGDFDEDLRIESIIGVGGDIEHGEGLIGDLIFIGCDRAGEAGDDFIAGIKSEERGLGKDDDDSRYGGSFRVPSKLGRVSEVPATRLVTAGLSSLIKEGVEWVFSASISHGS